MKITGQHQTLNTVQFLDDGNGGIVQAIPLGGNKCLIAGVEDFKEFEYSFEVAVPFSGDTRLAFNKKIPEPQEVRANGFQHIAKEFNRTARLSGIPEPKIIESFRTRLNHKEELLTFLIPTYREAGRILPARSLQSSDHYEDVPDNVCLMAIEARCQRDFDHMPSRGAYFFFYYLEKVRAVSHVVHSGPPLDCPGEEWAAKAYEGPLGSDIGEFFAHNDGAISIELQTLPRGLLNAALDNIPLEHEACSQGKLKFSPVMVLNNDANYACSPPKIPDRSNTSYLSEFKRCISALNETIIRAIEGSRHGPKSTYLRTGTTSWDVSV